MSVFPLYRSGTGLWGSQFVPHQETEFPLMLGEKVEPEAR